MIKKGDFIEIDYIAKLKSNNKIFDLTLADKAKEAGVFSKSQIYKPFILCVGEAHVIKGLDEAFEGKDIGKEFHLDIEPEKAFGKRNPKLIQLTSLAIFKKQKMNPFPGLQLNIDGAIATVRSVSGGRVILDFNNPLAGQKVHYWVKINRKIDNPEEQIKALAYNLLAEKDAKVSIKEKKATITLKIKDTLEHQAERSSAWPRESKILSGGPRASESKAFQGQKVIDKFKEKVKELTKIELNVS